MRASFKCPRVETSSVAPPPPSSTSDTMAEESIDLATTTATAVITVQAAHDQILVDMLNELRALQAYLEHLRRLPSPPPFDDV